MEQCTVVYTIHTSFSTVLMLCDPVKHVVSDAITRLIIPDTNIQWQYLCQGFKDLRTSTDRLVTLLDKNQRLRVWARYMGSICLHADDQWGMCTHCFRFLKVFQMCIDRCTRWLTSFPKGNNWISIFNRSRLEHRHMYSGTSSNDRLRVLLKW